MTDGVHLLLAEDEALILMAMEDALLEGGYTVICATNGAEAMALLEDQYQHLSGVITDIKLGEGPDGWAVARRARELKPDIPVVYGTGDSADEWTVHGVPNSLVLQKPFTAAQLVTAVSTLLINPHSNH